MTNDFTTIEKDENGNYILPMSRTEASEKKQVVMIDRAFIENKKLSATAKIVGITLCIKKGGDQKIYKTKIAKDLGISFKKLKAALCELESEGIITGDEIMYGKN
jgi:predicted Rossmann fold nucleotide-binding protein DprA/Smf involved in DNA uptake